MRTVALPNLWPVPWLSLLALTAGLAGAAPSERAPSVKAQMEVAAIYFPGFHRDDHYDAWFGEGWNEWRLLEQAAPRFPGQRFFRPAWGSFDEANVPWMERQIDLAADHGITVFVFDWYWYSGVQILQRPLEQGFLAAHNRERLKYALMWANHDWRNYFPAPLKEDGTLWLPSRTSPDDFRRLVSHCIIKHFRQPNYWRIDGRAYFGIFDVGGFLRQLGGPSQAAKVLQQARTMATEAGLNGIHFGAFASEPSMLPALNEAGFDTVTAYNICWSPQATLPARPLDDYRDLAEHHVQVWKSMDTGVLPFCPIVTVGWDPTPRWVKDGPFPPPSARGYPYTPIVTNNTPELFGKLFRQAQARAVTSRLRPPAIFVNAWNEWTEGSALLPDRDYGTAYLEQIKSALAAGKTAR